MTAAPYALRRVILHAARSKEYPAGSIRRGYDFIAPLTPEGRIDLDGWKTHRGECFAHRFWDDEPAQRGLLARLRGLGQKRESAACWINDLASKVCTTRIG